jgi:hypothetical protein
MAMQGYGSAPARLDKFAGKPTPKQKPKSGKGKPGKGKPKPGKGKLASVQPHVVVVLGTAPRGLINR